MSDNLTLSVGTIATQDTGGVHAQRTTGDVAATATVANVSAATTSTTVAASNTSRRGLYVFNDSEAALFLKYGTAASSSSFTVKVGAGDFWEMPVRPIFTGVVTGVWESASGTARTTEV